LAEMQERWSVHLFFKSALSRHQEAADLDMEDGAPWAFLHSRLEASLSMPTWSDSSNCLMGAVARPFSESKRIDGSIGTGSGGPARCAPAYLQHASQETEYAKRPGQETRGLAE
jgi:hypothetical protein